MNVGIGGGFGSDDPADWRWGALHTLTLLHNVSAKHNIPKPSEWPDGYPRHSDNFCVDAAHPGLFDRTFTFSGGPAIRHVFELTDKITRRNALPGGQSEQPFDPNYRDEFALWAKNEAPPIASQLEDVLAAKARVLDLIPPSAVLSE